MIAHNLDEAQLRYREETVTMGTTVAPVIRLDERGVAWITGTTTKVSEVVLNLRSIGCTPEQLQPEMPHLTLDQILTALSYYETHRVEVDAYIERTLAWVDQLRSEEKNPLSRADLMARLPERGSA